MRDLPFITVMAALLALTLVRPPFGVGAYATAGGASRHRGANATGQHRDPVASRSGGGGSASYWLALRGVSAADIISPFFRRSGSGFQERSAGVSKRVRAHATGAPAHGGLAA